MTEDLKNDIIQELESWNELKDKVLNVIPVKEISFRTRALLSDILDRLGLSVQDRLDLEKYIIYGGGENIEYIKSIIGDLSKKDSPFEKGEAEHSAVLKGGNNQATNTNEVALGNYNKSNSDTYFSVGIGTSDTRKNAVEVKQNGDVYITGIGGYNGTNPNTSKSVQEVINELVNKLNEITTND